MMRTVLITLACMAYAGAGFRVQTEAAFQPTGVAPGRSHRATSPSMSYSGGGAWGQWLGNKGFPKAPSPAEVEAQIAARSGTVTAAAESAVQDFLEFEPYTDRSTMPDNTFKPKSPFEGKIISVERIVGPKATGETCNVVIDHFGKMPYIEGQSYGVIPPGLNPKNGKPNKVRLYSIASSRYGDDTKGTTTTLCVRRATYWCPEMEKEDPAKKGVCSNYLCDASAGDVVKLTGPTGKVMLLPEDKPETDIIMVATGTGIAPYRSFLKRMFIEKTPFAKDFKGLAWLFLGVANSDALLYDEDWKAIEKENPDNFRYDVALSREMTNKDGGKMYIQDKVEEYGDEVFDRLDKGAHIYFCGLKGMMPGIQGMLEKVAGAKGLNYEEFIKKLKKNGQWHVEVY
uniref:ferredoxin--NADP(+) reductase n=1 Tax=Karenia brevis TaxID=156230 RepID=Q00GL9_KARBR|nr:plastid ferredoxin NADPH reductase protein precursor [Karenia brevis]